MREILFRGKRKDNGVWVYGDLRQYSETSKGIFDYKSRQMVKGIIPETVGQYTGLTDKNGTKIFEGDIVTERDGIVYVVRYSIDECLYDLYIPKTHIEMLLCHGEALHVIGNIHDNPELIESED